MKLTNLEAIEAQSALAKLVEMDLPILVSLDIALVSNSVDSRVKAFQRVRDSLVKTYSISNQPGTKEGTTVFLSLEGQAEVEKACQEKYGKPWRALNHGAEGEALNEELMQSLPEIARKRRANLEAFSDKFNELLDARTEELTFKKIQLPKEVNGKPLEVKPAMLKALTDFVEIVA